MSYQYKSDDGLCQSNNFDFINLWNKIISDGEKEEINWVTELRAKGVKAAHPDDGWVDRENNSIHFAYPQFDDGVNLDDVIALGWPPNGYSKGQCRLVKIIGIKNEGIIESYTRYYFKEM